MILRGQIISQKYIFIEDDQYSDFSNIAENIMKQQQSLILTEKLRTWVKTATQAGHQAWRFNLGQFFLWLSHYGPEMVCLQGKTEEVTAM